AWRAASAGKVRFPTHSEPSVTIGTAQSLHDRTDLASLLEPALYRPMAQPDAQGIDPQEDFRFPVKGQGQAYFFPGMPPVKMAFRALLFGFRKHLPVGLVFDVQELGRVEPGPGAVGTGPPAKGPGQGLPHDAAGVPDGLDGLAAGQRVMLLGAIAYGVYPLTIGFKVVV